MGFRRLLAKLRRIITASVIQAKAACLNTYSAFTMYNLTVAAKARFQMTVSTVALSLKKTQKRGFTLTELAIVLGVMGLILGAIWGAAARVSANNKTQTAIRGILDIVSGMRAAFPNGTISGGAQLLTPYAINSGIVPVEMLTSSCAGLGWGAWQGGTAGCAVLPGGNVQLIIGSQNGWLGGTSPNTANTFDIAMGNNMTASQCAAFLPALVQQAANGGGLVAVTAGGVGEKDVTQAANQTVSTFQGCSGWVYLEFTL